jgi:hypothetical protein
MKKQQLAAKQRLIKRIMAKIASGDCNSGCAGCTN